MRRQGFGNGKRTAGGSHGFNFETPEVFNREVIDFLAGVPTP